MSRTLAAINVDRDTERSKIADLTAESEALLERSADKLTAGQSQRAERLATGIEHARERLAELDAEAGDVLRSIAEHPGHLEHSEPERSDEPSSPARSQAVSRGLRAVERLQKATALDAAGADRLEALVRDTTDHSAVGARYLDAVSSDAYKRAFLRSLSSGPTLAPIELSNDEREAFRAVRGIMAERAWGGTQSAYAVPAAIDPSLITTTNGSNSPLREVARVVPIAVDVWKGIASAGITAGFVPEATEASDNAPTLSQPSISTEKAQAFVPFSIEIGMDWGTLESELAIALDDAKQISEGTAFVTGTGTNAPQGVLVGGTAFINTAGTAAFATADVYSLDDALPARYRPNATFAASGFIANKISQMESTNGARQFPGIDETPATLLRRRFLEVSDMSASLASGTTIAVVGDFSRYVIVDRIGLSIEIIPHLFGSNQRPTGQRGLYAFWRVGAGVVDANAFRRLVTLS